MKKITKLMLTLALLLVGVTGAKAEEVWVQVKSVNYSAYTGFPFYVMGFVPEWNNGIMTDLGGNYTYKKVSEASQEEAEVGVKVKTNDGTEYYRLPSTGTWHQYFIANGIPTNPDKTYIVKAMVKASADCKINVEMRWSWSENPVNVEVSIPANDDFKEVTWEYSGIGGTSCDLIAQTTSTAQIEWKSLEVGYNVDLEDRDEPEEPAAPKRGTLIKSYDYTTATSYPWYRQAAPEGSSYDVEDGKLVITNSVSQTNNWDLQPFILDEIPLEKGTDYVVRIKMNTTGAGDATINMGTWGSNRANSFSFADDYAYYDVTLNDSPLTTDAANVAHALFQSGKFVGKIAIYKVEVYKLAPIQWTNIIFNSDMEGSDDRCFYSQNAGGTRVQGVITDGIGNDGSRGIKVTSADRTKTGEQDQYGNDIWTGYDWDAQFFIRLPQMLPAGTKFRVSFDYKATVTGKADTQSHAEPGEYIWWDAIGSPEFTEEWQTYSKEGVITNEMSYSEGKYMHTIAFNLSCNHTATEFFFDNVKFEIDENDVTLPDFNYYVSGSMNNWTPTEDYQLTVNPDNADEYMITMDLEEGDEFKVVKGANEVWYPGTEGNYVVNESGNYTIYFRPSGNGGNDWYYGVIYLARNYSATLTANTDWDEVYAYVWTGDGDAAVKPAGAWPGKKMELVNGVYTLSFNANNAPANIIFNNGKLPTEENAAQTKDLVFEDGKAYKAHTVKFINTSNWTNVYAYPYSNNIADDLGWSGRKMIKIGTDNDTYDLYSYTYVGAAAPQYIIFNNGSSGGSNQTDNFTYEDGATYVYDGISSVTKTISAAGYATYCSPYALDFSESGLTAYVANYDGSRVNFTEVTSVPAKTGVLLKGAAGEYTIKTTDGSVLNAIQNILIGVLEQTVVDHSGIYVLMNENGKVGFYQTTAPSFTVGANTAYIDAIPGNNARFISLDEETTSIDVRSKMEEARGDVYNLNGQRVAQPTKGLYIINGRKVVVK